jgi:hypothetical protein
VGRSTLSTLSTVASVLLGPLLILGVWARSCSPADPTSDPSAAASKSREVLEAEAELAAHAPPEVVVLGNSASFHGVDADMLGDALGFPGKVAKIFVPASRSPAWYALLKNRVLGNGYKPKLVLVVAAHHHMIDPVTTDDQARLLRDQMGADDALIEEKVFGGSSVAGWLGVARSTATRWMEWPKDLAVGLIFGAGEQAITAADGGPATPVDLGRAHADEALGRLFALEAGADFALHAHAGPIAADNADPTGATQAASSAAPMDPSASMMGDLAALARDNGVRVVFVSFPMPKSNPTPRPGTDVVRATIRLLNDLDAGWIDLSRVPLPNAAFFDHIHLNEGGRKQFTEALIEALERLDPLNPAGMPDAVMPLVPSEIVRTGVATALPPLPAPKPQGPCKYLLPLPALEAYSNKILYDRHQIADASPLRLLQGGSALTPHVKTDAQACDGTMVHTNTGVLFSPVGDKLDGLSLAWEDALPAPAKIKNKPGEAWWVFPGTTLELRFDEAWDTARGAFGVAVEGLAVGGGGPFRVSVGDASFPLEVVGGRPKGSAPLPAPTGPWTLRIEAPVGAGALLVRGVAVGEGPFAAPVLGDSAGRAAIRVLGGPFPQRTIAAVSPAPRVATDGVVRADKEPFPHPKARIKLGPYSQLTLLEVRTRSQIGGCTPLRMTENGALLSEPNQPLKNVKEVGLGANTTQPDAFFFTATDNTDPATNGRAYAVVLDESRSCNQAAWVYPGDAVTVATPALGALPADMGMLEIAATPFVAEAEGKDVRIRVEVDGAVVLDRDVAISTLAPLLQLPLDRPIRTGASALRVTFTTGVDAPFLLVTGLGLVESEGEVATAQAALTPVGGAATGAAAGGGSGKMVVDLAGLRVDPKDLLRPVLLETHPGDSSVQEGAMSSGKPGLRLEARVAGSGRICPGRMHIDGPATARVHLKPVRVEAAGKLQTLRLDATYFGADGPPVKGDDGKPVQAMATLSSAGGWQWVEVPLQPPPGASTVQVCLRFAASTGAVEVDGWEVEGAVRK